MERSLTHYELIPNRIILRNNNYAQRKTLINKKFEWLNKYLSAASPKIINPNKFVASTKIICQPRKNRSFTSESRLSRLNTESVCVIQHQAILVPKNCNNWELRKTASSHLNLKQLKHTQGEESCVARFFRSKKTKTELIKSKNSHQQSIEANKRYRLQDSQIKPWNNDQNCNDDDTLSFKLNNFRLRG